MSVINKAFLLCFLFLIGAGQCFSATDFDTLVKQSGHKNLTVQTFSSDKIPTSLSLQEWQTVRAQINQGKYQDYLADSDMIYPLTNGDVLAQTNYLKASNTDAGDQFGYSVAISGDTLVVGAPSERSSTTGINGNQSDNSTLLAGAVYVFVRSGPDLLWAQQAYLKASNTDVGLGDQFGYAVSIMGDTLVVGAPFERSNATGVNGNQNDNSVGDAGAAYVFVRNENIWTQQAYLKASNTGNGDNFGHAVSVSGDTVVVGAYAEDSNATGMNGDQSNNVAGNAGAAYVFVRDENIWTQQAYLKASNTGAGDRFGHTLSISGDTLVVGADSEDSNTLGIDNDQNNDLASNAGAVYVFNRNGNTWTQQAYLKASNTNAFDFFGSAVSISGNTIAVGAAGESSDSGGVNGDQSDNSIDYAGAAYVFVRIDNEWAQQAYIKPTNPDEDDNFGHTVSISEDALIIGAPAERSNAIGVDGIQSDDSFIDAGAAYLFVRSDDSWSQQAYIKASNTDANDEFGYSVAISNDVMMVGAPFESSPSIGINNNQGDNSASNAGASYVFRLFNNDIIFKNGFESTVE